MKKGKGASDLFFTNVGGSLRRKKRAPAITEGRGCKERKMLRCALQAIAGARMGKGKGCHRRREGEGESSRGGKTFATGTPRIEEGRRLRERKGTEGYGTFSQEGVEGKKGVGGGSWRVEVRHPRRPCRVIQKKKIRVRRGGKRENLPFKFRKEENCGAAEDKKNKISSLMIPQCQEGEEGGSLKKGEKKQRIDL